MRELFYQLGVDWRLLFSQGVNFLILLLALTFFVYKPLLKIMEERRRRIEAGFKSAEEAELKLKNIGNLQAERMAKAEKDAIALFKRSEDEARVSAKSIVLAAEEKSTELLKEASETAAKKRAEELIKLSQEARFLIKEAIASAVRLDPKLVDEKLIAEAAESIKGTI